MCIWKGNRQYECAIVISTEVILDFSFVPASFKLIPIKRKLNMATQTETISLPAGVVVGSKSKTPLHLSGALDQYKSFDVTPVIGREFPEASLKEWLEAPNADELLKELAITSMFTCQTTILLKTNIIKSHAAVLCSSESRITSTMSFRRSWCKN